MLSKNKIDKNLKIYIREHLSKGYSRHAVRKVLSDHGYNEHYINELLKKHAEQQFMRKYAIMASLLFLISFILFNSVNFMQKNSQKITGYAIETGNEVAENITINLTNGSNFVLIKAVDKNGNKGFCSTIF